MKMNIVESINNKRLDLYLSEVTDYSRSKINKLIKEGYISVNGKKEKASYTVKENDKIEIEEYEEEPTEIIPQNINIDIVYEDDDLLIVNKPSGMVVHPGCGNYKDTLANALVYHIDKLSNKNNRPGIVHRIDKDTSGLLMVAKNDKTHEYLSKLLEKHDLNRVYIALVWGVIKHDTGEIDAPIGRDKNDRQKYCVTSDNSKHAITHFKVLKRYNKATLIELKLETGRTHQIRVHMNYIGYPIVNDKVYGKRKIINDFGQMLHAKTIGFIHPKTKKYMEFNVEPPKEFNEILDLFEQDKL